MKNHEETLIKTKEKKRDSSYLKKRDFWMPNYLQHDSYDKTDKYSIEKYGQNMVGKTFYDLTVIDDAEIIHESLADYNPDFDSIYSKKAL